MIKKFFKSFFLISLISCSAGSVVACSAPTSQPSVAQIESTIYKKITGWIQDGTITFDPSNSSQSTQKTAQKVDFKNTTIKITNYPRQKYSSNWAYLESYLETQLFYSQDDKMQPIFNYMGIDESFLFGIAEQDSSKSDPAVKADADTSGNDPSLNTKSPVAEVDHSNPKVPSDQEVKAIDNYSLEPLKTENLSTTTNWNTASWPIPDTNYEFAYSFYITTTSNYLDGFIDQNLNQLLPNPKIELPKQHDIQKVWFPFLFQILSKSKVAKTRSELVNMYSMSYYKNLLQQDLLLELPQKDQPYPHLTLNNSLNPQFSKKINLWKISTGLIIK